MRSGELFFLLLTLVVAGTGVYGVWLIARAFGAVHENLLQIRLEGRSAARHPAVLTAISEYEASLRRADTRVNVGVIVDRVLQNMRPAGTARISGWIRVVRAAISICVVVGLLGTFIGLTIALTGLSGSLTQAGEQANAQNMAGLLSQLKVLLGGMSTAFRASVFGVAGSAILTALTALAGTFTIGDRVANELEHYLCNEFEPDVLSISDEDVQRRLLERFDELAQSLEVGLAAGLQSAADQFSDTARNMGQILQQVEPITRTLGSSGDSLEQLGRGLTAVTEDMRGLMVALKLGQEALPQRMAELHQVEEALVLSLGRLQEGIAAAATSNGKLVDGADLFQSAARQLDGTLGKFREEWPGIVQQFVNQTEQAIEQHTLGVSTSLDGLRETLEESRREHLAHMEELLSANHALAQRVASAK
jgi:flagellar biosynthesis chaperone FliJ